jgi:multiple sugar transport system substrate-binding protein
MTMALTMAALASTAATPVNAQEVKLKWALWDWAATAYYKPLIEAYKAKKPNVTIDYVDLGSADYQTMLSMQLTGGAKDLDIVTIKDMPGYANLVRAKQIEDLTAFMPANGIDPAAYGGIVEQLGIDGHTYALPFRSDFWVVYYNKDLFDKAGVPYPSNDMTIAEYDALSKKLTSGMGNQKVFGSLLHVWRSPVQLYGILDGKHTVVEGEYEWLKPYYERALSLQKAGVVPTYASLKTSNTHYSAPFYNGSIATLPMGSWFAATNVIKVKAGESKAANFGIVRYPHPEGVAAGTSIATLTLLGVNSASANKAAALDFLKFVTGPEGAEVVAKTGTMPAIQTTKVIDTIVGIDGFPKDANTKAALKISKGYLEMPIHPKAAQIEVVLNRSHDAIMTENVTVDAGIAQMTKDVKAILAQP